jgi:hypothetical protein
MNLCGPIEPTGNLACAGRFATDAVPGPVCAGLVVIAPRSSLARLIRPGPPLADPRRTPPRPWTLPVRTHFLLLKPGARGYFPL